MNSRQRLSIAGVLVLASAVVSALAWPDLPAELVTHWNAAGEPEGTMSKALGLSLVPVVTASTVLLFLLIPRIDPLGENIEAFRAEFDWFIVVFTGFMTLVHVGIVAFNLGYEFDFLALLLVGMAGLFYYVGYLLDHAERNWFVGIRTPWTMSSEEVWDRTHDLGARLFKAAAVLSLVGVVAGDLAIYFVLVPILAVAAVLVGYSYWLYTRLERRDEVSPGELQ